MNETLNSIVRKTDLTDINEKSFYKYEDQDNLVTKNNQMSVIANQEVEFNRQSKDQKRQTETLTVQNVTERLSEALNYRTSIQHQNDISELIKKNQLNSLLTPQITAKNRQNRPSILRSIGLGLNQLQQAEAARNSQPIRAQNNNSPTNSINSNQISNPGNSQNFRQSVFGLGQPSTYLFQDKARGSIGRKILMVPTYKSLAKVKESIPQTQQFLQKFQEHSLQSSQNAMIELNSQNVPTFQNVNQEPIGLTDTQLATQQAHSRILPTSSKAIKVGDKNNSLDSSYKLDTNKSFVKIASNQTYMVKPKDSDGSQDIVEKFRQDIKKQSGNNSHSEIQQPHSILKKVSTSSKSIANKTKFEDNQAKQAFSKLFTLNDRPKDGLFVYSTGVVTVDDLFRFLVNAKQENRQICKFSITKGDLSDAGIMILSEFFIEQKILQVLKLYNNIMNCIQKNQDINYLYQGTKFLAKCFLHNPNLNTFEIHGFFLHLDDFNLLIDSLYLCRNLKKLLFSNTNIQNEGVQQLCRLLKKDADENFLQLESLTVYNNNVSDEGAQAIAEALKGNEFLKILNLQMNFIKDKGAQLLVDGVENNDYKGIWRIILLDNQCTENFKKKVKKIEPIII